MAFLLPPSHLRTPLRTLPHLSSPRHTFHRYTAFQPPHAFRRTRPSSVSLPYPTAPTITMTDYTLYYAPTPNGKKISLMLEELNASYKVEPINIGKGDQFDPSFIKVNPNSKIPALVDHTSPDGDLAVFESGAILEYLAEKHQQFLPPPMKVRERMAVKEWLYWQCAGFGPMLGQIGFFWKFSEVDVPVGKERYLKEGVRLFEVLNRRLRENKYVGGDEYSIADMACYWWSLAPGMIDDISGKFEGFENVKRWQADIGAREAVKKVLDIPFEA